MAVTSIPPDVLADALQDRIHPTSGRLLAAVQIGPPVEPPRITDDEFELIGPLNLIPEID